jgi:hypothetical protein
MGKNIMEIAAWTIIAALVVLVVLNASKFATAISSLTGFWGSETSMFTGSNYNKSNYGAVPSGVKSS